MKVSTRLGASSPEDGNKPASEMLCIFKKLDGGQSHKKEDCIS
jgi:hypothetical protein